MVTKKAKTSKTAIKKTALETLKVRAQRKREGVGTDDDGRIVMAFKLRFTAPLIMHAFDQKTVETILRGQGHQHGEPEHEPKIPRECLERATLRNTNGVPCILPAAFKKATASGAVGLKDANKLRLRSQFWVLGQAVPLEYDSLVPRMDMVKVGPFNKRVVDVRFRPQFNGVTCTIAVKHPTTISQSLLIKLLNRGGEMGVGEWRPSKGGSYGTYEIDDVVTTVEGIREVIAANSVPCPPLTIPEWAMDLEVSEALLKRIASGDSGPVSDSEEEVA